MTDAPSTAQAAGHDIVGRLGMLTMITELRWWGRPLLRLLMAVTERFPSVIRLGPMRAVAFTRWSILSSVPDNGHPDQLPDRPRPAYLVWETVFNGVMDPYIEQFVVMIPDLIRNTWCSSYGFPGTRSVAKLRTFIETLSWPAAHSYAAYPDTTVAMVASARAVEREHAYLVGVASAGDPDAFERAYEGFLRRRRGDL